jgi:DNA-binding CsgD family transcriptional regulator
VATAGGVRLARAQLDALACAGLDSFEFRARAQHQLRKLLPHDYSLLWTTDPATGFFTSAMPNSTVDDPDMVYCRMAHRNEFIEADYNKFRVLARRAGHVGVLSEATGGTLERSPRYQHMLKPLGYEHELRVALVDSSICWGAMMLWRAPGSPDFSPQEKQAASQLVDTLAKGLRIGLVLGAVRTEWAPDGPGLILLDDRHRVLSITPSAERWLAELDRSPLGLPEAVVAVAASLGSAPHTDSSRPLAPRARVRAGSGRWLTIHGSRTRDNGSLGATTAIIIEDAKPAEIAPIVVQAYGLSDREADLTRLILQGLSTKEIAAQLHLSPYTVQDYLKSVFEKVGVRSRRQLVARMFDQHYWPNYGRGDLPPDPSGTLPALRDAAQTE